MKEKKNWADKWDKEERDRDEDVGLRARSPGREPQRVIPRVAYFVALQCSLALCGFVIGFFIGSPLLATSAFFAGLIFPVITIFLWDKYFNKGDVELI